MFNTGLPNVQACLRADTRNDQICHQHEQNRADGNRPRQSNADAQQTQHDCRNHQNPHGVDGTAIDLVVVTIDSLVRSK